jgi:dsDNA-binding SOS-regulon protein
MEVELKYIGIVNGHKRVDVINLETGEVIGYNESIPSEEELEQWLQEEAETEENQEEELQQVEGRV